MTQTLATADLHLTDNPRDAYRLRWFEGLPALAKKHGAGRVLVLGDITEAKDGHRAGLVNAIVDGFAALAEVARVYVLRGNHDYLAEDVPFYRFLRHLPRVRWINEPTPLKLAGLGDCLFLPHTRSPDDWVDQMFDSYDWFFCHQTFNRADLGGRAASGGAFNAELFTGKNFRVVSGDVHAPQEVGPVTYVGTPYTVDFGDDYEPRVLLLSGQKMRSIPCGGAQKQLVGAAATRAGKIMFDANGIEAGDIIKVRVALDRSDISRAEARQEIRKWADARGVHLHAIEVIKTLPARAARPDLARASDADLVRAYAKKMRKGNTTVAAGLKIVEEVT